MNTIKICDICKGTNVKTLIPKLKEVDPNIEIIIGCQNFCGIGKTKSFAMLNNIPIIAETENLMLKQVNDKLKKQN